MIPLPQEFILSRYGWIIPVCFCVCTLQPFGNFFTRMSCLIGCNIAANFAGSIIVFGFIGQSKGAVHFRIVLLAAFLLTMFFLLSF